MQNRTNRNLLFGARATAAGGAATAMSDSEALTSDNQAALEHLRGSAGTMKDIALTIDTSVNEHNRALDKMDKRFDSANSVVRGTLRALNDMVTDRTSSRTCAMVGAFVAVLFVLYYFIKS